MAVLLIPFPLFAQALLDVVSKLAFRRPMVKIGKSIGFVEIEKTSPPPLTSSSRSELQPQGKPYEPEEDSIFLSIMRMVNL